MKSIVTLVSSDAHSPVTQKHVEGVEECFTVKVNSSRVLSCGKAMDLHLSCWPDTVVRKKLELLFAADRIDFFVIADDDRRRKKLLIADMDSTMVVGETLDDLAGRSGRSGVVEQIAAITAQAMAGKIEFRAALEQRVAMLKGLPKKALQDTLDGVEPMAGAEILVKTMRHHGALCILASGGFSCFTEPVAALLGFHFSHGNNLAVQDGQLTGKIVGAVVDHQAKKALLQHYQERYNLEALDCLAVGDGANDLVMLRAAGLGVGYHPKPYLKERIENSITYGDLTALLYAQGYKSF